MGWQQTLPYGLVFTICGILMPFFGLFCVFWAKNLNSPEYLMKRRGRRISTTRMEMNGWILFAGGIAMCMISLSGFFLRDTQAPITPSLPSINQPVPLATTTQFHRRILVTVTPVSSELNACALVNLNVRAGPGADYEIIGQLSTGKCTKIYCRTVNETPWVRTNLGYMYADIDRFECVHQDSSTDNQRNHAHK